MNMLSYFTPRRSQALIELENQFIFLFSPTSLLQFGVQGVQPSFSALFSRAPSDELGAFGPFLGTFGFDPCLEFLIFLRGPGAFYESRFEDLSPSMEALDWTSMTNIVADVSPAFLAIQLNCLLQECIFVFIPLSSFELCCFGDILRDNSNITHEVIYVLLCGSLFGLVLSI